MDIKKIFLVLLISIVVSSPVFSDEWTEGYSYGDNYSTGGIFHIANETVQVERAFGWRGTFKRMIVGRVMINEFKDHLFETEEAKNWASPRLAILNPDNEMERYEIRFYPELDKVQVNYVDRTNKVDDLDVEDPISDIIASEDCDISTDKWYYPIIANNGHKHWRVIIMSDNQPTCFLIWNDDRIISGEYKLGIQSAGKYLKSEFNKIFGV